VSWTDSGARIGSHEIGLIARFADRSDDDAARRLYRKYRMEPVRFGVYVPYDQGLAGEMVQESLIRFCPHASSNATGRGPVRGWLFAMARSAAIDIARRRSFPPLPPWYDTVGEALTTLTVDQALGNVRSIYSEVMRLVRDGGDYVF